MAKLWAGKGHTLIAGLREGSKDTDKVKQLGIATATPQAAVQQSEIVALALPWGSVQSVLASLGSLEGKTIVDATNPFSADLTVIVPEAGSGGSQVARWAAGAHVVKAFNTIGARSFGDPTFDMFYCGDDAGAKTKVRSLIEDTAMNPVDVGPLPNAIHLEHLACLWVNLALKQRLPGPFGFNLVRKS